MSEPEPRRPRRLLRSLLWKVPVSEEIDGEIDFHIEMRTRELVARGMEPGAARRAALERFGDAGAVKRECRAIGAKRDRSLRLREWLEELVLDLRFAFRQTTREASSTALVVLTLALGIGATAAVFSVVNAVVVRPLPFPEPDRLVRVFGTSPNGDRSSTSDVELLELAAGTRSFTEIAAIALPSPQLTLLGDGAPERLSTLAATGSLFRVLGVRPRIGRTFSRDEDRPGSRDRVAVLSHGLWERRFGADERVLGRELNLDGEGYRVIGVLPRGFSFFGGADVFIPHALRPELEPGDRRLEAFGRLGPGVSLEQAQADVDAIAARLRETYPETNREYGFSLVRFSEWIVGPAVTRTTIVLLAAVGLILLLACGNASNLLMARATTRAREIGLRAALGAGRFRILRQLVTESLALAVVGSGVGLLLASAGIPLLATTAGHALPRLDEASLDGAVLLVSVLATMLAGLLSGIAPALHAGRHDATETLKDGQTYSPRKGRRLREALVVCQLAAATVLVVGAGLVLASFRALTDVHPGFDTDNVLVAELSLPEERYPESSESVRQFYREALERIDVVPGVQSAAATAVNPFRGLRLANTVGLETSRTREEFVPVQWRAVTGKFFEAMSIPILRGRSFEERDRSQRAAVIAVSLAEKLWPGEDPIGKRFRWIHPGGALVTVIGVAGDIRDAMLDADPLPIVYHNQERFGWPHMTLMLRTSGDMRGLAAAVREAIWTVDPNVPVPDLYPLERNLGEAVAGPRFAAELLGMFAIFALSMASVGTYGVTSYAVARRRREIGIRMALGAPRGSMVRLVTANGLRLVATGVAVGTVGAFVVAGSLRSLLFETPPRDPGTFALAALVLGAAGALASYLPALRAARVSPLVALRDP